MADMEVQNLNELLQIRRDKLKELQEAGRDPFVITKYDVTHHSADVKENYDEMEGKEVSIAGRLMSKRVMGKASFCNIQDLKLLMDWFENNKDHKLNLLEKEAIKLAVRRASTVGDLLKTALDLLKAGK